MFVCMHVCMYVCAHMRICMCVYIISPRIKLVPLVSFRPSGPFGPFRTLPDPSSALAHDDMHLAAHQALLAVLRDGKHTCTILSGDATQAAFRREFIAIHGKFFKKHHHAPGNSRIFQAKCTMIPTYDHICTKNDIEYHPSNLESTII